MGLWDSITDFFNDLADFFSGKGFFEVSGHVWKDLMELASDVLLKDPSKGDYKVVWSDISDIESSFCRLALLGLPIF